MVKHSATTINLIVLMLLLLGCAPVPSTYYVESAGPGTPTLDPVARATQAARNAQDAQATINAQIQLTANSVGATVTAVSNMTATANGHVAETAVSGTSTIESLEVMGTMRAMDREVVAAESTLTKQISIDQQDLEREAMYLDTVELQQIALVQENIAQQSADSFWANARRVGLVLGTIFSTVITIALVWLLIVKIQESKTIKYANMGNGVKVAVLTHEKRAPQVLSPGQYAQAAIEANLLPPPTVLDKQAMWNSFSVWNDTERIPLGVNKETGKAVLANLAVNPHLLISGMTGAGKSASGLIPLIMYVVAIGKHVVIANGAGSDFNQFHGRTNVTILPTLRGLALIESLADFLEAAVQEMARRDGVLKDYGVSNWVQLPPSANEQGEFVLVVDEFLKVIKTAQRLTREAGRDKTPEGKEQVTHIERTIDDMWYKMEMLASESRKFGIFLFVTLTDPTSEQIGKEGMALRRQMSVLSYRMGSADSSRKLLGVTKRDGFPNGSVGIDTGDFVYNLNGSTGLASGFYPSSDQIDQYLRSHVPQANPLPPIIIDAIGEQPQAPPRQQIAVAPPVPNLRPLTKAEQDGKRLTAVIGEVESLSMVARFISGIDMHDTSKRPSGQQIGDRVSKALGWRIAHMNCPKSRQLLARKTH